MPRGKRKEKSQRELLEEIVVLDHMRDKANATKDQNQFELERVEESLLSEGKDLTHLKDLLKNLKIDVKDKEKDIRVLKSNKRKRKRNIIDLQESIESCKRRRKLRVNRIEKLMEFNPSKRGAE